MDKKKKISFSPSLFGLLAVSGFTIADSVIIAVCLNSLDGANCLTLSEKEISVLLGISKRTVASTMAKLVKGREVARIGSRYDFTIFSKNIQKLVDIDENRG